MSYATILLGFALFFMQIHVVDSLLGLVKFRFVTIYVSVKKFRVRVQVCFFVFSVGKNG